ncbi:LOG family protein [Pseudomonas aeruginosa]|nr:LOG family protein [Pseudomonas aeruginosa]
MSWRSESPFTVGFRAYVGFWFHCSPNPGYHAKPLGLLEVNGFYDPLLTFLDHLVDERFVRAEHRGMLQRGASPEALLDSLAAWTPSVAPKWVDRTPQ